MKRLALIGLIVVWAGCGSTAPARTIDLPPPPRHVITACHHEPEPVPASCVPADARGRLLEDDHDAGLRLWEACEDGDGVVDGSYVGERVGNGRDEPTAIEARFKAHQQDVWKLGVIDAFFGRCSGATGGGCIRLAFQQPNEDVPAVAADLLRIFATDEDVCLPFRIDTGVDRAR